MPKLCFYPFEALGLVVRASWLRRMLAPTLLVIALGCGDDPTANQPSRGAHLSVLDGDGQVGFPNDTLADSIRVQTLDAEGRPRAGVRLAWTVTSGDGSLTHHESITDVVGRSSAAWHLGADTLHRARVSIVGSTRAVTFVARARGFAFDCAPKNFENGAGDIRVVGCSAMSVGGFAGSVLLSSVAVAGLSASFSPASLVLDGSSAIEQSFVHVSISSSAESGDYVLNLHAASEAQVVIAPLRVRVR